MFTHERDLDLNLAVFLFSGPTNTDDDFEQFVASMREFDRAMVGRERVVAIEVIEEGNATPSAAWRKKIADATTKIESNPLFILVSRSAVVRGGLTAVNWLRPPRYRFAFADDFLEALRLADEFRGSSLEGPLRGLLVRAQALAATEHARRAASTEPRTR